MLKRFLSFLIFRLRFCCAAPKYMSVLIAMTDVMINKTNRMGGHIMCGEKSSAEPIWFGEIAKTDKFLKTASKLAFILGRKTNGEDVVYDIAKAPHILMAGDMGSGVDSCINALILSILYKAEAEDVRFIMIDSKAAELNAYNGIPHLLVPVITEPEKAADMLEWAVGEMMRRYDLLLNSGAEKLEEYNRQVEPEERLPFIVIVINELSELMTAAKKSAEDSVMRIAQAARAAGIHLIISTKKPCAHIITRLIKTNIPTRAAFKVSSAEASRVILDTIGAEKLVGSGDMLFRPIEAQEPQYIKGVYVSDEERTAVVEFIKAKNRPK